MTAPPQTDFPADPDDRDEWKISWDGCPRSRWEDLLARAGDVPLEQSWRYGDAVAAFPRYRVRRALISRASEPVAAFQAFERRIPALGTLARITRGPVLLKATENREFLAQTLGLVRRSYRIRHRRLALWMPELPDGPDSLARMAGCGARRMATGYSSIRLDLKQDEDALRAGLHGAWRGSLKSAERAGMKVEITRGGTRLEWLTRNYNLHRRRARYVGPPPDLIRAFAVAPGDAGDVLMLRAIAGREPVAGILILRHGPSATFFIAWSGEMGRRLNAHNLLLWRGIRTLKSEGVRWFDAGGVNADAAPGVARFKLGLGGQLYTLAGTFI